MLRKRLGRSNHQACKGNIKHFALLSVGILYVVVPTVLSVAGNLMKIPMHEQWLLEVSFLSLLSCYGCLSEALKDIEIMLIFHELKANFGKVKKWCFNTHDHYHLAIYVS